MIETLIVLGAAPFIILGTVHGIYTAVDAKRPFRLTPRSQEVREAMQSTALKIHPSTNTWQGWIGFNFSHSLGAVTFGALYVFLAVAEFSVLEENTFLSVVAVLVSGSYLVLAYRYWFIIPLIGIGFGFACFLGAAVLLA
jgi:hypothetical protein